MYENKNLLQNKLLISCLERSGELSAWIISFFSQNNVEKPFTKSFWDITGTCTASILKKKKNQKREKKVKEKNFFEQLNKVHKVFVRKRHHWSENSPSKFWLCKLLLNRAWTTFSPHQNYSPTTIYIHGQLESMCNNHYQLLAYWLALQSIISNKVLNRDRQALNT